MADVPTHREYDDRVARWRYAWEMYTGAAFRPERVDNYLIRRRQGEHPLAYEERKNESLADPALDYGVVVDSLNGMQFAAESKTMRQWAETSESGEPTREFSFGDPEDDEAIAHRLWTNVDGNGKTLITLGKDAGARLLTKHTVWGYVDTAVTNEDGDVVRPPIGGILEPEDVLNWRAENGRLVEAIVSTSSDPRDDVWDEWGDDEDESYLHYTLEGWRKTNEDGEPVDGLAGELHEYEFHAGTDTDSPRVLPLFREDLPLPREVGYLLARKAASIFNMESELDWIGRITNLPKLGVVSNQTGKQFDEMVDDIASGEAILQLPPDGNVHQYIMPPAEAITARSERLEKKRQNFYVQAMREYGRAAQQETATGRRQDWAAGIAALLTLQSGALQQFETQLMRRMEQATFPDNPSAWGQYRVSRTDEFEPEDIRETFGQLVKDIFGSLQLPVDADTAADVVTTYLDEHGQNADKDAIRDEVERRFDRRAQASDAGAGSFL